MKMSLMSKLTFKHWIIIGKSNESRKYPSSSSFPTHSTKTIEMIQTKPSLIGDNHVLCTWDKIPIKFVP